MQPLAFVDLETTGATASQDRITEIGIILVDEHGVEEWSTLVNPESVYAAFSAYKTFCQLAIPPVSKKHMDSINRMLHLQIFSSASPRKPDSYLCPKTQVQQI